MVLEKMVEAGKLDRAVSESTKKQPLGIAGKSVGVNASDAPYFTDYLMRQIERQYQGDEQSLRSLRIYSTIDLNLQRAAYDALTQNMVRIEERIGGRTGQTAGLQAALVAMNAKTGEVVAMIGGRDYSTSQLNRATDAKRQPGSVFKPFVYAAALELGESGVGSALTAASLFFDQPQTFDNDGKPYRPGNFGDKYENRPITVRDALVDSKNVITVEIAQRIGLHQVKLFADKAGIQNVQPYPSAALGVGEATPLQIAAAYTAFANEGTRVAPIAVRRLTTRDGKTLYTPSPETNTVMSRPLAWIMTSIMKDVLDRGTGTQVRQRGFTGTAAGKTGSSRDAWFAGYTPNLVCVVWIGYDNNTDIGLTGGATAAPIWADFMINAMKYRPDLGGEFIIPEGLTSMEIDPATGNLPQGDGIKTRTEYFLLGTSADGQPLPDSFTPEADANPEPPPVEGPRPTPTPFAPARPIMPASPGASSGASSASSAGPMDISGPVGKRPIPAPSPRTVTGSASNRPATPAAASPGLVQGLIDRFNQVVNLKGLIGGALLSGWKDGGAGGAVATPTPAPRPSRPASTGPARPAKASEAPANVPANVNIVRATPALRDEEPAESGSFYLTVCEKSGLLPVEGLCIGRVRRRFSFGKEPTRNCRSDFHR
jgi:penicillin-binding protein 1B